MAGALIAADMVSSRLAVGGGRQALVVVSRLNKLAAATLLFSSPCRLLPSSALGVRDRAMRKVQTSVQLIS